MRQSTRDFFGLGVLFWLAGYILSLVLYFVVAPAVMGWIILAVMSPVIIGITWWWFRSRSLPLSYFVKVGVCWMVIAAIADYIFIVLLFSVQGYYRVTVLAYYVMTFLIPIGMGLILTKKKGK